MDYSIDTVKNIIRKNGSLLNEEMTYLIDEIEDRGYLLTIYYSGVSEPKVVKTSVNQDRYYKSIKQAQEDGNKIVGEKCLLRIRAYKVTDSRE